MASENFRTLIVVNNSARNGEAKSIWKNIRSDVLRQIRGQTAEISFTSGDTVDEKLKTTIQNHRINCIISAGGDGSVNHIVNLLMNMQGQLSNHFYLGAIGLGSSNDFIKPVRTKIRNIPVRLGFDTSNFHDIGVVNYCSESNFQATRYFIINAGLGVVAEANSFFNSQDLFLGLLKNISTNSAIIYTAIRSIIAYKNIRILLIHNGLAKKLSLSNLSIIKNNFISGSFHYDQLVDPGEGRLGLNYCYDMTKWELIRTLIDLNSGNFTGKPKTHTSKITQLDIIPENQIAIETDGEVFLGKDIHFTVRQNAIQVLGL